jgi:integrase
LTSDQKVRTRRRATGEGSIYWIESRQLWAASVTVGFDHGRQIRKTVKAKRRADVAAKLRQLQDTVDKGLPIPDRQVTTGQFLETWLADALPRTVKEGTVTNYRDVVEAYILPHVAQVPLAKLGPEHVIRMMSQLERAGLAPRTVRLARTVLRRALGDAVAWGKANRNAAALTKPPRKTAARIDDALDAEQALLVLNTAAGHRLEALAVLVLAVGLRQGEALALRWPDLNLDAATIKVSDSKTEAGVRTVALPAFAVDALRQHRVRQLEEREQAEWWGDPGLVFASTAGTNLDRRNTLRWWHDLTERAGVGRRRFHASRHTAATLMLNGGVPLEVVSATLGHAGLAITADVYAKVRAPLQRTAADTMDALLGTQPKRP